ncbi:hypothetical protein QTH13_15085 [Clostridium perfringens]|nr:hypothetical protein [Clostridium perfringens]MDM0600574.1 hypothetical protein [Clostridium perfringens]MDU4419886.1 hypothetical protein [Clostridium perfringens]MDU7458885.1 hypothetical protein [Clostridium perfringens]
MNSTEREIYDKYAYKKTHIYLVYEEFERRVNSTENQYDGLKKGECKFDYSSWEKRLGLSHWQMNNAIKTLIKDDCIEQRIKGKKGTQSTYFLTRFNLESDQQKKQQNYKQKEQQNKSSNINRLEEINQHKEQQKNKQETIQSSIYNNLNIKSNINNIYSPLANELYYDEVNKNLEKDLIKRINSKYPKDIIKEEFEKLKYKGFSELDLLKELDKNLKSKSKVKKDKYSEDSKEYKLSILLRDLILRRDENSRCKNADMQKWSKEIDLLHRKDNRSYENIEKIIRWCQQDTFWKANILSTHKLREKFDSLYQKAFCENKSYNRNNFKNDSSERSNDTDGECWYFKDSL